MIFDDVQKMADEYVDWLGDMSYTPEILESEYNQVIFTLIDHDDEYEYDEDGYYCGDEPPWDVDDEDE